MVKREMRSECNGLKRLVQSARAHKTGTAIVVGAGLAGASVAGTKRAEGHGLNRRRQASAAALGT